MIVAATAILIPMVEGYLEKKIVNSALDGVEAKIIKERNKKWKEEFVREKLEKELEQSEFDFNEDTIRLLNNTDKESTKFKTFICNSVFFKELPSDDRYDFTWFVTEPPCEEGASPAVKKDVDKLITKLRKVVWSDSKFLKRINSGEFQTLVLYEMEEMWQDIDNINDKIDGLRKYIETSLQTVCVEETHPVPSAVFTGRKDYMCKIKSLLEIGDSIYLYGLPGIGKTELCKRYLKYYLSEEGNKTVWLDYTENLRVTLNNQLNFYTAESSVYTGSPEEAFHSRISLLSKIPNLLMVIDNYTMDGDFQKILQLPCKKIIVSEEKPPIQIQSVELKPLSMDESLVLLKRIVSKERHFIIDDDEESVRHILEVINSHTNTICVLGEKLNKRVLDTEYVPGHAGMLTYNPKEGREEYVESSFLYDSLYDALGLDTLNEDEEINLALTALIPKSGMYLEDFEKFSGMNDSDAELELFYKKGFLVKTIKEKKDCLNVNPLVFAITRHKYHPLLSSKFSPAFKQFIEKELAWLKDNVPEEQDEHFYDYLSVIEYFLNLESLITTRWVIKFWCISQYLSIGLCLEKMGDSKTAAEIYEAGFRCGFLTSHVSSDMLVCYVGYLNNNSENMDEASIEKIAEEASSHAESFYDDTKGDLIRYYTYLANAIPLKCTELKLRYLEKARNLDESGVEVEPETRELLYKQLAELSIIFDAPKKAKKYDNIVKECGGDSYIPIKMRMGINSYEDGEYGDAVLSLEEALKEIDSETEPELYLKCNWYMAMACYRYDSYKYAIKYYETVLSYLPKFPGSEINPAETYLELGYCHYYLGQYEEAMSALGFALKLHQNTPLSTRNLIEAYYYKGLAYNADKAPKYGHDYIEKALQITYSDNTLVSELESQLLASMGDCSYCSHSLKQALEEYMGAEQSYEKYGLDDKDLLEQIYEGIIDSYIASGHVFKANAYRKKLNKL